MNLNVNGFAWFDVILRFEIPDAGNDFPELVKLIQHVVFIGA